MDRKTVAEEPRGTGTAFAQDDFFKIDPEAHLVGRMESLGHFPGVQMWWRAIENIRRPLLLGMPPDAMQGLTPSDLQANADPEALLAAMDRYGVDLACLLPESMMDTTGYSTRWVNNGDMVAVVERHPDRFLYQPNLSPILHRGVKNAIWELEYWVKERGARIFKFYPPEDTYINDPALWPFYERAEALGVVLDIHTGFCWVPPGKSKHALPVLLDDVARDFPGLKIVAFHMGYPYTDDLNMVAMGHPNVHVCLSLLVPWALSAPRKFAHILGEALRWVGPDRIIWGTDCAGFGAQIATAVRGLREFQIPEDLREGYGYPAITDDDRRKIFGLNLARLIGIEPRRRVGARAAGATALTTTGRPTAAHNDQEMGMGKSAKEMFGVLLPKGLAENAVKAKAIGVEFAFKVSGPNGGSWTVDLKASPPAVKPEASATAQCTVSIADSDFEALMGNPKLGMQLFMQGKLKVAGNPALATKLEQVFQLAAT